ncbi:MAG: alpha/beta fold hydrolase [Ardenticatenia bacterium]|nr:alpha/beta fold hydrolase [Ardenticatenia bacterium]
MAVVQSRAPALGLSSPHVPPDRGNCARRHGTVLSTTTRPSCLGHGTGHTHSFSTAVGHAHSHAVSHGHTTPHPSPTPTPSPLAPYTIEGLRSREYPGGTIEIRSILARTATYTRYYIAYPSDGLTITGVMHVPTKGDGPFPVIILNHGYIPPSRYWSGADTNRAAEYLVQHGYLTIAPDFRGWGGSDPGPNYFRTGLVIDVLNLISSLPSLPQADPERVGMWGHSMGGGITTKAIVVDPRIRAAVLYAPVSANDREVIERWGGGPHPPDVSRDLWRAYKRAQDEPTFLRLTSPIYYMDLVTAPVQIHQGTADRVTPPAWAEAIRNALIAADKYVEYYTYEGQGHAFQGQAWLTFLERTRRFFDRFVKGDGSG